MKCTRCPVRRNSSEHYRADDKVSTVRAVSAYRAKHETKTLFQGGPVIFAGSHFVASFVKMSRERTHMMINSSSKQNDPHGRNNDPPEHAWEPAWCRNDGPYQ
jgi:hypothetical protein